MTSLPRREPFAPNTGAIPHTTTRDASTHRSVRPLLDAAIIREGTLQDFDTLARFHYLGGRPAAVVRVLRAELDPELLTLRTPTCDACLAQLKKQSDRPRLLLGVLMVSVPVLNSRLRHLAWPGRYRTTDRRADTRRVNRELRTLSRVVIDPRVRGIGLAARLVRAYLHDPLTPATEAIAAMGACCPFFRAAGMTSYQLPLMRHESRFADALASLGVTPTDVLSNPAQQASLVHDPFVRRELDRFSIGNIRRHPVHRSINDSLVAACASLCTARVGYAHTRDNTR